MDAGCKTPWIAKKTLEDSRIPILPYTRYKGRKNKFRSWDFTYDLEHDCFICPRDQELRYTTTSKDGRRTYHSNPKIYQCCPCRQVCGDNEKGQRLLTTHICQEHLDLAEQLRKTQRGLARVSTWVRIKFAAINLKKLALCLSKSLDFSSLCLSEHIRFAGGTKGQLPQTIPGIAAGIYASEA